MNTARVRLRVLRAERGLTQMAVARRLGMSQQKYWQIENGYAKATEDELSRLARIFKVDVDALELQARAS